MADNELQITLTLDDKASKEVAAALKSISGATEDVEKTTKKKDDTADKGNKKTKDGLLQARDAVRAFHKEMYVLAIAFGTVTAASVAFAQVNNEVKTSLEEITLTAKNLFAQLGRVFAPVINSLGALSAAFNNMFGNKNDAVNNNNELERSKNAIKDLSTALQNHAALFQAGKISASEYYQDLINGAQNSITQNKVLEQSFIELANLQTQLSNNALMDAQTKLQEQISLLNFYKQEFTLAHQGMSAFTETVGKSIQTNLSSALTNIITGAMSAKEAFAQLGKMMIQTVVDFMVQKVVASVLEKTLLAGTVAASTVAGAAVAAAWAPAALATSLATFGANAAPASAGIASTSGVLVGAFAALKAAGGTGLAEGTDSVPAMLTPGEMVFPRSMADAIRAGDISVGGAGGGGDITINLFDAHFNNDADARRFTEMIGFEVERKARNARSIV